MPVNEKPISTSFFKSGISEIVDRWAGDNNTTRHKAAMKIISSAIGGEVKVSFDDHNIIAHLPEPYVQSCYDSGKDDNGIIENCIKLGLQKLDG
ncbi:MAG: hypothetical protein O2942_09490 [Proteobacteria bacterium]|nr:hypothetical protein [Pseudomonadota bacterium]